MNILYIGNKLEEHGVSPTGVDTLPLLLEEEGYKVTAVSSINNPVLRMLHMLISIFKYSSNTDRILIDTYSTSNFWYAVVCGYLAKLYAIPYIFILHGGELPNRFSRSGNLILDLFRKAEWNITPSEYLQEQLQDYDFPNLRCIPNSIDLSQYPFKARKKISPRILWVRAIQDIYQPKLAIETLEYILINYPDANLCMVGGDKDGSLQDLENHVTSNKLPVIFTGRLSKTDWTLLSREYDIFLNTSSVDNTPVSIIEAMALGLPIVSSKVGGIPYLINNKQEGLLVDNCDPGSFVAAISQLLEEPEFAMEMTKNARKKAETFDWKKVKQHWKDLLN